jgi:hypothetical protein
MEKIIILLFCLITLSHPGSCNVLEMNSGRMESNDTINAVEIQLGQITGFVFSKAYCAQFFNGKYIGFDLTRENIEELEIELNRQYVSAWERFMKIRFQEMYAMKAHYPDAYDWKELKKSERKYRKYYRKNGHQIKERLNHSVRQYLAYVNASGEKIVKIILVDFRDDPNKFRSDVDKGLILGCGDWFETNVKQMHYHLDSKKITVNEDF